MSIGIRLVRRSLRLPGSVIHVMRQAIIWNYLEQSLVRVCFTFSSVKKFTDSRARGSLEQFFSERLLTQRHVLNEDFQNFENVGGFSLLIGKRSEIRISLKMVTVFEFFIGS